jgi:hypothetical protein
MNPDLERPSLDSIGRRQLSTMLREGPWCWPSEQDSEPWARACELVPGGPPAMAPGTVPLVTVDRSLSSASLLVLRLGDGRDHSTLQLEAEAVTAWDEAAIALPRSLPILWSPVKLARDAARTVLNLATVPCGYGPVRRPSELRGRSFGLSFVLCMASKVLDVPVPEDVIASAIVDANGKVGRVEGLECKILAVERDAPRIRRFLVADDQLDEAKAAATSLVIVPVASAAQAVEEVLGKALRDFVREAGGDSRSREELVGSFFRLAIMGRGAAIDWNPVERGAGVALDSWKQLDPNQRWRLQFAQAVAARHENNRGEIPVPDDARLAALPATIRLSVVVNLIQHCADTGKPRVEFAQRLVDRFLVPVEDALTPQMKLWGARARLMAVTGQPEDALRIQEQLARAWLERLEYEEISYQLSEWYRLAGALNDRDAFQRGRELHDRVWPLGGLDLTGSRYVDLAASGARVRLELIAASEPRETLQSLSRDLRVPVQMRWSAVRWLACLLAETGEVAERDVILQPLVGAAATEKAPQRTARTRLALVRLDSALRQRRQADIQEALSALQELDPGPVGHLIAAAQRIGRDLGEYVARFYPY